MSAVRVVILGAGFGGLELAARLSTALGGDADIALIDESDTFHFGFSKLDVLVGAAQPDAIVHPYTGVRGAGVRFVRATITAIDPARRRVITTAGDVDADYLVIALGARVDPSLTPGLTEFGDEFYTLDGAVAARRALAKFDGGRILIAVTTPPFKCPPAPSEAALLVHDQLTRRGVAGRSTITVAGPFPVPIPPSPEGSAAVLAAFEERGITWRPGSGLAGVRDRTAVFADESTEPFDLLLAVPQHRVPDVVADSGLCVDGWVHVDERTLATDAENVYAIGDVAAANSPKAGAFAVAQAAVVAERIVAAERGGRTDAAFDATGACLMEFGGGRAARVAITGRAPAGGFSSTFDGPQVSIAADKSAFESATIRRWFAGASAGA